MSLVDTAEAKAVEVLHACVHDRGFKAAAKYYPQVWARDSIITALGALTCNEPVFVQATKATLASLAEFQCPETGRIANYIPIDQPDVKLPVNEAFDSNLWFVIGHDAYLRKTNDTAFIQKQIDSVRAAIRWARFMDYNNDGLIETHDSSDWRDTWLNHYHNLNINALYAHALHSMTRLEAAVGGDVTPYHQRRERLIHTINANFWINHNNDRAEAFYKNFRPGPMANNYASNAAIHWISDFYFPRLPMKERAQRRIEVMGNFGAILYGIASDYQTNRILNYIHERGLADPYPIRVTYPVVRPGDPDYREYYNNRGFCNENCGHNGGIWPFVGGFYVAALVKAKRTDEAAQQLERLAELNKRPASKNENQDVLDEWGFNEHCHGQTARGLGAQWQAWSAGMFLYAREAVRTGTCYDCDDPPLPVAS